MKKGISGALTILAGGLIYVFWRRDSLLMFSWFTALGIAPVVDALRAAAAPVFTVFPSWIYFSLPHGLYLYGGLMCFEALWQGSADLGSRVWPAAFAALTIGAELGQRWSVIPGQFDWVDLGVLLACVVTFYGRRYFGHRMRGSRA
jgi:hypothetical protein